MMGGGAGEDFKGQEEERGEGGDVQQVQENGEEVHMQVQEKGEGGRREIKIGN